MFKISAASIFCLFVSFISFAQENFPVENKVLTRLSMLENHKAHAAVKGKQFNKKDTKKVTETVSYVYYDAALKTWTDTSEKYIIQWGVNGLPKQLTIHLFNVEQGGRYIITDFVRAHPAAENSFKDVFIRENFIYRSAVGQLFKNNEWQNVERFLVKTTFSGLIEEEITQRWVDNNWQNADRRSFTYTADGKITGTLNQKWSQDIWTNANRRTSAYDDAGNEKETTFEIWNGEWQIVLGTRRTYQYDTQKQITAVEIAGYNSSDNSWQYDKKQTYEFNAKGEIASAVQYNYFNGAWVENLLFDSISWNSFDNNQTKSLPLFAGGSNTKFYYTSQRENDKWVRYKRTSNTFNTAGSPLLYLEEVFNGNTWDSVKIIYYDYYKNNDVRSLKNMDKIGNEPWSINTAYVFDNLYDSEGDIISEEYKVWYPDTNAYISQVKTFYTYTSIIFTGIEDKNNASGISLYPNPVTNGNVYIKLESEENTVLQFCIYDNIGKCLVKQQGNSGENIPVDISSFSKGIYHLSVRHGGQVSSTTFIVR